LKSIITEKDIHLADISPDIKNLSSEIKFEEDEFYQIRQKSPNRWILKHVFHKRNKYYIFAYFSLAFISTFFDLSGIAIIGYAIEDLRTPGGPFQSAFYWALLYASVSLGSHLISVGQRITRIILAQKLELDVRKEFYLSLIGKGQSFHDRQELGQLMARATNDVRYLNFLISPGLANLFIATVSLISPFLMLFIYFPVDLYQLVLFPLLFVVFFLIAVVRYLKKLTPLFRARMQEFGTMNAILNESLEGIEVIKSMAQEKQNVQKYRSSAVIYRDMVIETGRVQALYYPILYRALMVTLGLTHCVILNFYGFMTIDLIIVYLILLSRLGRVTESSIYAFFYMKAASIGAERLIEKMQEKSDINENMHSVEKNINGYIEFKNVSFSYPGTSNLVLKDISFNINPGQTVAIVGTTGSGKTTITKLLSRLYDINDGIIKIDGIDVKEFTLNSLRDQIAYIEQDVFLFSKSAYENISFGRESFTRDDIIIAAKEAQAHDFISALPEQYDTEVGERGIQLSGGERQRIAIARAFLSDPKILILDDASSAIDAKTEEKIQLAISRILENRTTIIITHRLSQIRWADLILVLKDGEIIAQGTHMDLIKKSEEYRKIFIKKFDKSYEELVTEGD
jgi:ATP-binding cassette subfamily B protein